MRTKHKFIKINSLHYVHISTSTSTIGCTAKFAHSPEEPKSNSTYPKYNVNACTLCRAFSSQTKQKPLLCFNIIYKFNESDRLFLCIFGGWRRLFYCIFSSMFLGFFFLLFHASASICQSASAAYIRSNMQCSKTTHIYELIFIQNNLPYNYIVFTNNCTETTEHHLSIERTLNTVIYILRTT